MTSASAVTVSVKGRPLSISALRVGPNAVVALKGRLIKTGEIHDEFWLARQDLPKPEEIVSVLRQAQRCPDLFTFAQKLPEVSPQYSYHVEWDNFAVACFDSYADWFDKQVDRSVRKHIRKSIREGVITEAVPYTDDLVNRICEIYNESPIRQGTRFWHFGKSFSIVKAENGTYLDRSVFIVARYGQETIGFLKFVFDGETAAIMQILSKTSHFEKRPTNALLAKAIEVCAAKRIRYFTYGKYVYGTKNESSLIDFKHNNGFTKVDVPRYYIPLTLKGRLALKLGLHRDVDTWIPPAIRTAATDLRARWYKLRMHTSR
jgi:hypothetical protein